MRIRPFDHIENSLEFMVERPFAVLFRRSVQPAEIGKRLKREMSSGGIVTVRGRVAPNDFTILLNSQDAQPYLEHGRVLSDEMSEWLEEIALDSNLTMIGAPRVTFEVDQSIRPGRFEVISEVSNFTSEPVEMTDPGRTEAFEIVVPRGADPFGFVEVCSGPGTGAIFPVRKQVITIGRELSNDLVIDSADVSRFHAELHTTNWVASIVDRQSLNGTFLNGTPVRAATRVESGDVMTFGAVMCRYWREL